MPIAPPGKTQCNVYLPIELVTAAKHAAIDTGESLSTFVEHAIRARLATLANEEIRLAKEDSR
jgi:post-segregation antitoxin (ccd killing protein)